MNGINETIALMDAKIPPLVKKATDEIRYLDEKVNKLQVEIRNKTSSYIKNLKSYNRDQKAKFYNEIKDLLTEAEKHSDRKVELSQQLYDTIDDNIKIMDEQDKKFRSLRVFETKKPEEKTMSTPPPAKKANLNRKDKKKSISTDVKPGKTLNNETTIKPFTTVAPAPLPLMNELEMPIDPNEPIYCKCHSVSFGEMVACDNKDCPTEWFHFSCVGLTEEPPGKWYCDTCKVSMSKKKK